MFQQAEAIQLETPTVSKNGVATCSRCGAKNVLCSPPPCGRHIDARACDAQIDENRRMRAQGKL